METRHNTSLLEKAVGLVVDQAAIPTKRAEADASLQLARATGLRRVATGGAVAIGAVGIGLAAWLALNQPLEMPGQTTAKAPAGIDQTKTASIANPEASTDAVPAQEPSASRPPASGLGAATSAPSPTGSPGEAEPNASRIPIPMPAPRPDIITTNFTKFVNRTTYLNNQQWKIEAGHHYMAETDANWSYAWCYTRAMVDGVTIDIPLAQRPSPGSLPSTRLATRQTLDKTGLDDAKAQELAAKCPWFDGKAFGVTEEQEPPRPRPPAETKVVERVL